MQDSIFKGMTNILSYFIECLVEKYGERILLKTGGFALDELRILAILLKGFSYLGKRNFKLMIYRVVSIDPEVMSGTPVFRNTGVPIQNLFDCIEGGSDLSEFLDDFPSVKKNDA